MTTSQSGKIPILPASIDIAQSVAPESVGGLSEGTQSEVVSVPSQGEKGQGLSRWKTHLTALLEPGRPKSNIAALDGVRALACLIVVGYHINLMTRSTKVWFPFQQTYLAAFLFVGGAGVTLFFVLSGFLLFLPYARALLQEIAWPSARRFYLRRALRIIPAYYICLFVLILVEHREYFQPDHWGQLALFLTFFMDSSHATYMALNGPFWTLAVEWQFYLLLPLLVLGMRAASRLFPSGKRLGVVLLCLLAIIAWGAVSQFWNSYLLSHHWPTGSGWEMVRVLFFGQAGKYLQDFAIGMLACLLYTYMRSGDRFARSQKIVQRHQLWLWSLGIALFLFMAFWHDNSEYNIGVHWLDGMKDFYSLLSEALFSSAFALCILVLLLGSSPMQRVFTFTPLRWIGNVSYSTYMWHLPLLIFFLVTVGHRIAGWNPLLVFSCYWLWVLLVILPFSVVTFLLTERPGMWLAGKI